MSMMTICDTRTFINFLQAKDKSESAKRTKPIKVSKIRHQKMLHGKIW